MGKPFSTLAMPKATTWSLDSPGRRGWLSHTRLSTLFSFAKRGRFSEQQLPSVFEKNTYVG